MAEEDLGAMVQGPAQAPGGGGWQDLLADPKAQAFMLNAGLQMLTPGWGPQLGQVLGAGASGMKGVEDAQRAESRYQDAQDEKAVGRASREREAELNRTSRESIEKEKMVGRMEIEGVKNDYRMARLASIYGASDEKDNKEFNKAYLAAYKKGKDAQIITRASEDQIMKEAESVARNMMLAAKGKTASAAPGAPAAGAGTTDKVKAPFESVIATPQGQAALKTAAGRNKLMKEYPDRTQEIMQNAPDLYNIRD
jgi:hypothetical protein